MNASFFLLPLLFLFFFGAKSNFKQCYRRADSISKNGKSAVCFDEEPLFCDVRALVDQSLIA